MGHGSAPLTVPILPWVYLYVKMGIPTPQMWRYLGIPSVFVTFMAIWGHCLIYPIGINYGIFDENLLFSEHFKAFPSFSKIVGAIWVYLFVQHALQYTPLGYPLRQSALLAPPVLVHVEHPAIVGK